MGFALSQTPLLTLEEGVLSAPISSAGPGNPLSSDAINEVAAAVRALGAGELPEVRVLLLYGPGKNFCAGGDVAGFAAADDRSAHVYDVADRFHELVRAIEMLDVPVVAQASGWAAGAGLSLLLGADVVVGGPDTTVLAAYAGLGFTPDGGMSWYLPRVLGARAAATAMLLNEPITGRRAYEAGIITDFVEDGDVAGRTEKVCATLARGPRESQARIKRLLRDSRTNDLGTQLDAERESISQMASHPEGVEGVNAFVEKRRPEFPA